MFSSSSDAAFLAALGDGKQPPAQTPPAAAERRPGSGRGKVPPISMASVAPAPPDEPATPPAGSAPPPLPPPLVAPSPAKTLTLVAAIGSEPEFAVGDRVAVPQHGEGTVCFYGAVHFQPGVWVGVELDVGQGKNDGCVQGQRYFTCKPQFGIFIRPSRLALIDANEPTTPGRASDVSSVPASPGIWESPVKVPPPLPAAAKTPPSVAAKPPQTTPVGSNGHAAKSSSEHSKEPSEEVPLALPSVSPTSSISSPPSQTHSPSVTAAHTPIAAVAPREPSPVDAPPTTFISAFATAPPESEARTAAVASPDVASTHPTPVSELEKADATTDPLGSSHMPMEPPTIAGEVEQPASAHDAVAPPSPPSSPPRHAEIEPPPSAASLLFLPANMEGSSMFGNASGFDWNTYTAIPASHLEPPAGTGEPEVDVAEQQATGDTQEPPQGEPELYEPFAGSNKYDPFAFGIPLDGQEGGEDVDGRDEAFNGDDVHQEAPSEDVDLNADAPPTPSLAEHSPQTSAAHASHAEVQPQAVEAPASPAPAPATSTSSFFSPAAASSHDLFGGSKSVGDPFSTLFGGTAKPPATVVSSVSTLVATPAGPANSTPATAKANAAAMSSPPQPIAEPSSPLTWGSSSAPSPFDAFGSSLSAVGTSSFGVSSTSNNGAVVEAAPSSMFGASNADALFFAALSRPSMSAPTLPSASAAMFTAAPPSTTQAASLFSPYQQPATTVVHQTHQAHPTHHRQASAPSPYAVVAAAPSGFNTASPFASPSLPVPTAHHHSAIASPSGEFDSISLDNNATSSPMTVPQANAYVPATYRAPAATSPSKLTSIPPVAQSSLFGAPSVPSLLTNTALAAGNPSTLTPSHDSWRAHSAPVLTMPGASSAPARKIEVFNPAIVPAPLIAPVPTPMASTSSPAVPRSQVPIIFNPSVISLHAPSLLSPAPPSMPPPSVTSTISTPYVPPPPMIGHASGPLSRSASQQTDSYGMPQMHRHAVPAVLEALALPTRPPGVEVFDPTRKSHPLTGPATAHIAPIPISAPTQSFAAPATFNPAAVSHIITPLAPTSASHRATSMSSSADSMAHQRNPSNHNHNHDHIASPSTASAYVPTPASRYVPSILAPPSTSTPPPALDRMASLYMPASPAGAFSVFDPSTQSASSAHIPDFMAPPSSLPSPPTPIKHRAPSEAGIAPHPIVAFGFGGKFAIIFPPSGNNSGFYQGGASVQTPIRVASVRTVLEGNRYISSLVSYPGPLTSSTSKDTVIKFINERASSAAAEGMGPIADARRLLWEVLRVAIKHYGNLGPAKEEGETPAAQALLELLNAKDKDASFVGAPGDDLLMNAAPQQTSMHGDVTALTHVQQQLLSGKSREAWRAAFDAGLWSHALLLSRSVDEAAYQATVAQFATASLPDGSPLRAFYLVLANSMQELARPQDTKSPQQRAALLEKWQENLAILLANKSKDGVDVLWSRYGCVEAAHICYLAADHAFQSADNPNARLVLLGGDHKIRKRGLFSAETLQRTEILEYSRKLANSQYNMATLAPYKLLYAMQLADLGILEQAYHYLQQLQPLVQGKGAANYPPVFVQQVNLFAHRMSHVSAGLGAALTKGSRWNPLSTMSSLVARGLYAVIGDGEAEDEAAAHGVPLGAIPPPSDNFMQPPGKPARGAAPTVHAKAAEVKKAPAPVKPPPEKVAPPPKKVVEEKKKATTKSGGGKKGEEEGEGGWGWGWFGRRKAKNPVHLGKRMDDIEYDNDLKMYVKKGTKEPAFGAASVRPAAPPSDMQLGGPSGPPPIMASAPPMMSATPSYAPPGSVPGLGPGAGMPGMPVTSSAAAPAGAPMADAGGAGGSRFSRFNKGGARTRYFDPLNPDAGSPAAAPPAAPAFAPMMPTMMAPAMPALAAPALFMPSVATDSASTYESPDFYAPPAPPVYQDEPKAESEPAPEPSLSAHEPPAVDNSWLDS